MPTQAENKFANGDSVSQLPALVPVAQSTNAPAAAAASARRGVVMVQEGQGDSGLVGEV